jgi:hypothetical protein
MQGKGIVGMLVRAIFRKAKELNYPHIHVWTEDKVVSADVALTSKSHPLIRACRNYTNIMASRFWNKSNI